MEASNLKTISNRIGLTLVTVHLLLYITGLFYVAHSNDGQAPLMMIYFTFVDMPVSLLDLLQTQSYSDWMNRIAGDTMFLRYVLFIPNIVHIVGGSLWWYFLPRLFLPKRLGGIWGSPVNG
jgi:hypothetical protein